MSKSPSLRRIQADIRELALDPSDQYHASPLENDMFEWHFTIRGAKKTDFEGGIYHGRILLPPDYPFKPPHIMFLTPSGRFETNTKICLSFSAYHPELWQPAWGIRLILEALISFLPTPADGAIGALNWSSKERKRLAKKSVEWCCPQCGNIASLIPHAKPTSSGSEAKAVVSSPKKTSRFAKEIEQLQQLQMQQHNKEDDSKKDDGLEKKKDCDDEAKDESVYEATANQAEESTTGNDDTPSLKEEQEEETKSSSEPVPNLPEAAANILVDDHAEAALEAPMTASGVWWMLDPLLQLIIVVFSAVSYILVRKVQALCADLQALDA